MKYLGTALAILMVLSLAIFFTKYDSIKNSKLREEYKSVSKTNGFVGKITDLHTKKGISYVTINSNEKVLLDISRNESYSGVNIYLSQMLTIGDSLVKKNGSDSLIVYKSDGEYCFLLGEIINKK